MLTQSVAEQPVIGPVPDELLLPDAKLLLYPSLVRCKNAKEYLLLRLGCRTMTMLWTTSSGVLAWRLLKKGYPVGEVSARLGSMLQCGSADIEPLLKALLGARMVRSIAGRTVEGETPSLRRELRQRFEFLRVRAGEKVSRAFMRSLPVAITHRTMCVLRPKWTRRKTEKVMAQAQQSLVSVFGSSLSEKRIGLLAHQYIEEQVRRDVDLQLLSELPELKVAQWLRRFCVFQGLEHLDNALAKGNGVLASGFHFSSSQLLALLLWLRGYSFVGAGGIPWNNHNRALPSDNPELARQLKGCGDVKWYATFTLESALNICRGVNRGGMALVFPDGIAARAKGDLIDLFGHDAARYKRAQCEVPFLGRVAQANTGVPWIYKQSSAPLIPIKLVRDSFHRFRVIVGPEIKLERAAPLEKITADLYQALEREIRVDPAGWIYWRILDQFTTRS